MGNAGELTRDLAQRVPGQSLIEQLLVEWDQGHIRMGETPGTVVIDDDARGWYWGVLGERRTASLLSELDHQWTVLHSVPVGSGKTDIDHVAIGPGGVFTINTKYSPGAKVWAAGRGLMVGGEKRNHYLSNSMAEAIRATRALSDAAGFAVPVYSVIAFVNPASVTIRDKPGWNGIDLHVVSDRALLSFVTRRREVSDDQLNRMLDAAMRPEVWHTSPVASAPGRHLGREFDALREAVGPALDSTRPDVVRAPSRSVRAQRPSRAPAARPVQKRTSSKRRRSRGSELLGAIGSFGVLFAVWYFFTNVYGK